jgi:AraC family transcriptional regulator of adaptative response / DNA-3-methyladenine glycosylase II
MMNAHSRPPPQSPPRPNPASRRVAELAPWPSMSLDRATCYRAMQTRDARFDGRFFVAVRTTGIYCRPICPARTPKLANVEFHASAASAQEAGFRPCLRCRPECSPALGPMGTSRAVSRALALVGDGALDEGDVGALAARVGLGERQLRRLFVGHLGASPIAVAQTRRVLLAKQLLHETRLPMADVAFAAGFGSLRRFNDTFARLYGRPPSALRRELAEDAPAETAITLTLPYAAPYDWRAMLAFLAARAIPGVEVVTDRRYARAIELDGAIGTVAVTKHPTRDALAATIAFPDLRALPAILARLRRLFDLACDARRIAAQLAEDPLLAPLVAKRPGLRVPGAWDPFELAVRAILGQQITVSGARKLAGAIAAKHGTPLANAAAGGPSRVFPSAARLAGADLSQLGMPRTRIAALGALATAAARDASLFAIEGDLDAKVARLRTLPGIGEWTAHYIAMRALGEPDAFPAADVGLLRAATEPGRARPTPAALLARAEAWRPWRAYAAQQLWTREPAVARRREEAVA